MWGCFPSLLLDLRTIFHGDNEYNGNLLHKALEWVTTDPCLSCRCLYNHWHVWVSLLWGHCSLILGPGMYKVLFVPSKSLFPQSCVSSGTSMVGLMVTSSKWAYAKPKSATLRAPAPAAGHCWHIPPQDTLRHSLVKSWLKWKKVGNATRPLRYDWNQIPYDYPLFDNTWEESSQGHDHMANTEIRLIIFFAAKDGEALHSQQKQDQELTVAQIMNSLLSN